MTIQQAVERTLTAHQLAHQLLAGPDLPVFGQHDAGDHWHTPVAPTITELIEGYVKWSDYHNMPQVVDEDRQDLREEDKEVAAILLY